MPTWKTIVLKSFGFGAGFALMLGLIVGLWIWHASRPKPPKPWNTSALMVAEPPSFDVSKDGMSLELEYSIKNNTDIDYKLDDETAKQLRKMFKMRDGELSPPLENKGIELQYTPIFIPAGLKGTLAVMYVDSTLPTRTKNESDADFHERVRAYLEAHYPRITGLVLYDEVNRYQINLPKWAEKKPTN